MKTKIQELFKKMYGDGASFFASPGRVNLIGEHTDYNLGFVLPGAIDKAIYVGVKPNDGQKCRIIRSITTSRSKWICTAKNRHNSGPATSTA